MVSPSGSASAAAPNVEFRLEIFNLFNQTNFANPVGTLPNALPTTSLTEANKVQPGQPFTSACRRHVRKVDEHGRHDGRPRHEPSDAAGVPPELLTTDGTDTNGGH